MVRPQVCHSRLRFELGTGNMAARPSGPFDGIRLESAASGGAGQHFPDGDCQGIDSIILKTSPSTGLQSLEKASGQREWSDFSGKAETAESRRSFPPAVRSLWIAI